MYKSDFGRRDRLIKERRHDTYRSREKMPSPTRCPSCGALFLDGRWTWATPATPIVQETRCPACQRIEDKYPAGHLTLQGPFFAEHRDELLNMIHNVADQERALHPLERIMAIVDAEDHTVITTTGTHLARRLGEALARSYKGTLALAYVDGDAQVQVTWER